MLERLQILQANKKQFANGSELLVACTSNEDFKREIEYLSKKFLHRNPSGCSNCYMDAYLELINTDIKKLIIMSESKFKLKHGYLLKDVVNFDVSKNMTVHNTTDELAMYHLRTNPSCASKFEKLPENWEELVKQAEKEPKTTKKNTKQAEKEPKTDVEKAEEKTTVNDEKEENVPENIEKTDENQEKTE